MPPEHDFYDPAEGARLRDEGMALVASHTPQWYMDAFDAACLSIMLLVGPGGRFSAEDVRPLCGNPPNHPNAFSSLWGGFCRWAVGGNFIRDTGDRFKARRPSSHRTELKIYQVVPLSERGRSLA